MLFLRTIIITISLILIAFNAHAKTKPKHANWKEIVAGWNNGTVAPPYRESGELQIYPDGRIVLISQKGYDNRQRNEKVLRVSENDAQNLYKQLIKLGALSTKWKESQDPPVGGSQKYAQIKLANRILNIPTYANSQTQREKAIKIWEAIIQIQKQAVPVINEPMRP